MFIYIYTHLWLIAIIMVQLTGIWWLNTGLNFNIYKSIQLSSKQMVLLRTKWERLQHLEPTKMVGNDPSLKCQKLCHLGSPSQVDGPWPKLDNPRLLNRLQSCSDCVASWHEQNPSKSTLKILVHSHCLVGLLELTCICSPASTPKPWSDGQCHWRAPSEVRRFD